MLRVANCPCEIVAERADIRASSGTGPTRRRVKRGSAARRCARVANRRGTVSATASRALLIGSGAVHIVDSISPSRAESETSCIRRRALRAGREPAERLSFPRARLRGPYRGPFVCCPSLDTGRRAGYDAREIHGRLECSGCPERSFGRRTCSFATLIGTKVCSAHCQTGVSTCSHVSGNRHREVTTGRRFPHSADTRLTFSRLLPANLFARIGA